MDLEKIDTRKIFAVCALGGVFLGASFWYWQNVWTRPESFLSHAFSEVSDYFREEISSGFSGTLRSDGDFLKELADSGEFHDRIMTNPVDELRKIGR